MSKITKKELHPSLIKYISELAGSNSNGTGGGSSLVQKKNTVIINTQTSEVNIGIPEFDKTTDILIVFKNSVYLEENLDYTISEDSSKIISVNGNWNTYNEEMVFNFIVFKNVPELTKLHGNMIVDNSITIDKLSSDVIALIETTSNFSTERINIESSEWVYSSTDNLYYKDITHDLQNEYVFVISIFDEFNDSIHNISKFIDENTIRIFNEEPVNAKAYILANSGNRTKSNDNLLLEVIKNMEHEIEILKTKIEKLEK